MAATFMKMIRSAEMSSSSTDESDVENPSLSGEQSLNSETIGGEATQTLRTPPIRKEKRFKRLVFPLSAMKKIDLNKMPIYKSQEQSTETNVQTMDISSSQQNVEITVGSHENTKCKNSNLIDSNKKRRISTKCVSVLYPKAFHSWQKKRKHFLTNKIKTTKYTLLSFVPKNLFEQFHRIANFYFLLIIILNFLPMINAFDKYVAMIPLCAVLGFQAAKDIFEDMNRYVNDKKVNNLDVLVFDGRKPKEGKHRFILPSHMKDIESLNEVDRQKLVMQKHYLNNSIKTTKYTILSFLPKNLFEQFHRFANCYFVFVILLNFIPAIGAIEPVLSTVPVIAILLVQAIKDVVEDYGRYRSDAVVNNSKTEVYKRADDKYHNVKWKNVEVGDIVRLFCNRVIPADVLLLHSSDPHDICYIETSNIDGETNLKQRMVCKGVEKNFSAKHFTSLIQCEKPNNLIEKFNGNIINSCKKESINKENLLLRGCVIRNTDYVEGIVVYAGHETKAMLNNNGPRYKRSKLERRMNLDVIWCVLLLVLMCLIGAVGNGVWAAYQSGIPQTVLFIPPDATGDTLSPALSGFYMFWTMVILLQILIPISLYVSIEIVKAAQVYFINRDLELYDKDSDKPLECRALNITEDLGQVQYVFSDKTGTLTENSMVFKRCTVGGVDYPHAANAARIENNEPPPPEMNPASNARSHQNLRSAVSAGPVLHRGAEHRSSYRRPASSVRAHHRRNPSTLSVRQLQNTYMPEHHPRSTSVGGVPDVAVSAPNTPAAMRRATSARASVRRNPQKHHRRNISAVSAKAILSNLASTDQEIDKEINRDMENEEEEEEGSLETDVTPDPVLYEILGSACQGQTDHHSENDIDKRRILDFFINLAICNTVVLSTDNPQPRTEATNMTSISSQPVETFRSLTEGMHEASNNLYSISSEMSDDSQDSTSNLNNSNSVSGEQHLSFSAEYLRKIRYEAESPDEAALVYAAHAYGCSLAHRTNDCVTVTMPKSDETLTFEVLHTLTFDSTRKRMSVIVKDRKTQQYVLYCKGADSTILNLLRDPSTAIPEETDSGNGSEHSASYSSYQESNDPKVCRDTSQLLDQYARMGLRTLCIAKKVLSDNEYNQWLEIHTQAEQSMENREEKIYNSYVYIEKDLELLGATGVEDRLQEGVPETIESLRRAGMQVWVITGDKQETAVNIGYSCNLIERNDEVIYLNAHNQEEFQTMLQQHINQQHERRGPLADISPDPDSSLLSFNALVVRFRSNSQPFSGNQNNGHPPLVIVIDGKTLEHALSKENQRDFVELARRCHSVLVCRATPLQKGEVVKLVKDELHVMTLAIGDGANDVSMIQVADIGVGISGQEGMQAVMSSDFAMARFRFLQRLLLVHGHWNYARLAAMVLYFFYKNAAFVFLIFWFQFVCGFSGANPIEQWYLLLFNLIFTSVPPLINGALDKDVSAETLLKKPRLYLQGINNELYTPWSFWINILDAIYQSLVMFLIPYFTYLDSDVGMITWGTPVTTACMFVNLIHLGIETKTWTWIHWACQIGSILVFFGFSLVYDSACVTCTEPISPLWVMQTLVQTTNFWFSVILATVIALLPRYVIRTLQSAFKPSECQRERILERTAAKKSKNTPNSTATTSMNGHSADSSSSTYQNATYNDHGNAVDAMHYDFADSSSQDHMYHEVSHNTNQNNSSINSERSRSRSAPPMHRIAASTPQQTHGLVNPVFAAEHQNQNLHQEPETGEMSPEVQEAFVSNSRGMNSNSQISLGSNNESSLMKSVEIYSENEGSVHRGMTPVADRVSLSDESSDATTPSVVRQRIRSSSTENSIPTRLYVSSQNTLDQNYLVSTPLPNMVERNETNTPVGRADEDNFFHTVA